MSVFKREYWQPKDEKGKKRALISPKKYWNWIAGEISDIGSSRLIAIGDFNLDPSLTPVKGYFRQLFVDKDRWAPIPKPSGDASHFFVRKGVRGYSSLDHALLSRAFPEAKASYVAAHDGHCFGGLRGDELAMSDHAVLVLDVGL